MPQDLSHFTLYLVGHAHIDLGYRLHQAGGRVVDDLLDIGRRYYNLVVAADGDPIAALADRLLSALPTPTKHHPSRRRDEYLVTQVRVRRAHGVIFCRQKFCDPHGFDYALVRPALEQAGIPNLLLELEQTRQAGRLATRIEAFFETFDR